MQMDLRAHKHDNTSNHLKPKTNKQASKKKTHPHELSEVWLMNVERSKLAKMYKLFVKMHCKETSEFPSYRHHLSSNNQGTAAFLHASFHNSFLLLPRSGVSPDTGPWLMHPQQGMAVLHDMHHSPFPGEGKELTVHIRQQGFTKGARLGHEVINIIFLTI